MTIAAKITAGYAILIGLLLAVVAYQISLIRDMQAIEQRLSNINFRAAQSALRLLQDLQEFQEFTEKYLKLQDFDYGSELNSMYAELSRDLNALSTLNLSRSERSVVDLLQRTWGEFSDRYTHVEESLELAVLEDGVGIYSNLEPYFEMLGWQMQRVIDESRNTVEVEVERSRVRAERIEWVSWGATGTGLGLSFLVSFLIVKSISRPLAQLARGAREIEEGDFSVRVDESGSDEVAELATRFNRMVRRLQELDQLKKDFVSHVSHELKAPLASMQETTHLLLEQIPGPLNEKQQRLLELNLQSAERLSSMIRNLLDLSVLEAGVMQYDFSEEDVVRLVSRVLEEYQGLYLGKRIRLKTYFPEKPILAYCDGNRMVQVVGNLLANAVNFSPEAGEISVGVACLQELPREAPENVQRKLKQASPPFCLISVADQGPGIPPQHREKIFEKFHEVQRGRKMVGQGTGLGLAISRSLLHAHGGEIWVTDNPGGGSIFQVVLPARQSVG